MKIKNRYCFSEVLKILNLDKLAIIVLAFISASAVSSKSIDCEIYNKDVFFLDIYGYNIMAPSIYEVVDPEIGDVGAKIMLMRAPFEYFKQGCGDSSVGVGEVSVGKVSARSNYFLEEVMPLLESSSYRGLDLYYSAQVAEKFTLYQYYIEKNGTLFYMKDVNKDFVVHFLEQLVEQM